MKNEFYEYVCPSKRMTREKAEVNKTISKKEDLIIHITLFALLLVFSLPMAMRMFWLWSIISAVYIVLFIISKIDKDPYSNTLCFLGSATLYLSIALSYLIVTESYKRFQISSLPPLLILTGICVASYEATVFIKILLKQYTARATKRKTTASLYTGIGVSGGVIIGFQIARLMSPYLIKSLWSVWLVLIGCALLFTVSVFCFQRIILYKALYKKANNIQ